MVGICLLAWFPTGCVSNFCHSCLTSNWSRQDIPTIGFKFSPYVKHSTDSNHPQSLALYILWTSLLFYVKKQFLEGNLPAHTSLKTLTHTHTAPRRPSTAGSVGPRPLTTPTRPVLSGVCMTLASRAVRAYISSKRHEDIEGSSTLLVSGRGLLV